METPNQRKMLISQLCQVNTSRTDLVQKHFTESKTSGLPQTQTSSFLLERRGNSDRCAHSNHRDKKGQDGVGHQLPCR